MEDGRDEGLLAIGDRGQAAISLTPDVDGTHVRIFESSQLEGSCVGDLLYLVCTIHLFPFFKTCLYYFLSITYSWGFAFALVCMVSRIMAPQRRPPPNLQDL